MRKGVLVLVSCVRRFVPVSSLFFLGLLIHLVREQLMFVPYVMLALFFGVAYQVNCNLLPSQFRHLTVYFWIIDREHPS